MSDDRPTIHDSGAEPAGVDRLEHSEQWRVRTFELDSNGHVNNAVYLNYAEVVATEHAEALGYGREWTDRHQIGWAVHEHHVTYHRPAVYRDLLRVTTRVGAMGGVRAKRYTEIRREPGGELLAEVETTWVCVRRSDQRPTRIPADLLDRYADRMASRTDDPGT
jgi:acyl-CoA thioester hydrolase